MSQGLQTSRRDAARWLLRSLFHLLYNRDKRAQCRFSFEALGAPPGGNGMWATALFGVLFGAVILAVPEISSAESIAQPIARQTFGTGLPSPAGGSAVLRGEDPVGESRSSAAVSQIPAISFGRALDLVGRPVAPSFMASVGLKSDVAANMRFARLPAGLPVAATSFTSSFGSRFHPLLGFRRVHAGLDLAAVTGTPVVATSAGIVSEAQWSGGYGLLVVIDHGGGVQTRYGHMSRLAVASGARVGRNEVIGYVGSTGLSTGPHLHYEVRVNGVAIDPYPLLRARWP